MKHAPQRASRVLYPLSISKKIKYAAAFLALAGSIFLTSGIKDAHAALQEKDLQVILRALAFQENSPSGTLKMAILHDPSNAASKADADAAKGLLSGGFTDKGITLQPMMVTTSSINNVANADLIYVTDGINGSYGKLTSITNGKGILTVGTDKACVTDGGCIMYVQSSPSVEIVVNISSAGRSAVAFKSAFRMMIDEIN